MKSLRSFFDKGTIKYAEYLNVCATIWMVNSSVHILSTMEDKMFVLIFVADDGKIYEKKYLYAKFKYGRK